jgi:hypothetical protein
MGRISILKNSAQRGKISIQGSADRERRSPF